MPIDEVLCLQEGFVQVFSQYEQLQIQQLLGVQRSFMTRISTSGCPLCHLTQVLNSPARSELLPWQMNLEYDQ